MIGSRFRHWSLLRPLRGGQSARRVDCSPSPVWEVGALIALASLGACAAELMPIGETQDAVDTSAPAVEQTQAFAAQAEPMLTATSFVAQTGAGAASRATIGTTYYVRTDGGDAGQCDGRADKAYPGRGRDHACAWSHPFVALPPGGKPRIDGGDTLIIGGGSYMMGQGAPGTDACIGANCHMPPIPSGPSASQRTRITGKAGTRPTLWGTEGTRRVLDLDGSSNVEVGHLEITDRSDCVASHGDPKAACRGDAPHGQWARTGIYARGSRNVRLHDLDVHGLAHTGINAGDLRDWTVERVRINANGRAGWDGNVGKDKSSNAGRIVLRDVEIGWNGCGERWRSGEPWACWAQKTGGYGDGLGTQYTGGQWLFEDVFVHHNTSDGLDLRYMDGADSTNVTIRRLYAIANAGNQLKVRGNATVEDSVLVGRCGFFKERRDHMIDGDHCRAGGNTLQLVLTPSDMVLVRNSTITGEGGALIGANEGDESARIRLQNNVLVGSPTFRKPGVPSAAYYANKAPADVSWADNVVWKVKGIDCPGNSICDRDPKLTNPSLSIFDATPRADSPFADKAGAPGRVVRSLQQKLRSPRPAAGGR
ncbi:right-handed parallel beta-helix repeat-containing protein [Lysobacter korlensis]|uniref:Right-handed parallel beta-helix repeat-containing protein n=1 Tax=Lysobacter korlensis TaxID=553636 RepID=A0ABV6RTA5_9GAMM